MRRRIVENSRVFKGKSWGRRCTVALLAMLIADQFPQSRVAIVIKYAALGYVPLDIAFTAIAGCRRRLPHWTRESWRRFFKACAIPIGALVVFWILEVASEFGHPMFGAARSTQRDVWIAIMLVFMIVGAAGLGLAMFWLWDGDASAQFTRFRRRQPASGAPDQTA